jgi:hypothetical protein
MVYSTSAFFHRKIRTDGLTLSSRGLNGRGIKLKAKFFTNICALEVHIEVSYFEEL